MSTAPVTIDVPRFISERRLGSFQYLVVALCALTIFFDGYDTQSVAFVGPSIATEWHITKAELGPLFSASLVGLLVGNLFFGVIADRIGRRRTLIGCTFVFGIFTLAAAFSGTLAELLILRFFAGLGLGGGMPNSIALTAEYVPENRRATAVMLMFTGFSIGAAAAGGVAAAVIPTLGWRAVWWIGGALPLLLVVLQIVMLPESVRYLLVSQAPRERVMRLMTRVDREAAIPADARLLSLEPQIAGMPVARLFTDRRALGTVMLWIMFFANLLDLFFLQNWIPVLAHGAGVSLRMAVIVGAVFQVGGVVACVFTGFPIDRYGATKVLPLMYFIGFGLVIALGHVGSAVGWLLVLMFLAGFCIVGGQNAANALAAIFYPTAIRSTGVGWSLGIGRIGGIVGPVIAGILLSVNWAVPTVFLLGSAPLFLATLACLWMGRHYRGEV